MKSYKIAVIPGDGIGKEVVPEGIRVLDAAVGKFGLAFDWQHFDWSCQLCTQTGRMMPEDGLEQIRHHEANFCWQRRCQPDRTDLERCDDA